MSNPLTAHLQYCEYDDETVPVDYCTDDCDRYECEHNHREPSWQWRWERIKEGEQSLEDERVIAEMLDRVDGFGKRVRKTESCLDCEYFNDRLDTGCELLEAGIPCGEAFDELRKDRSRLHWLFLHGAFIQIDLAAGEYIVYKHSCDGTVKELATGSVNDNFRKTLDRAMENDDGKVE